MFMLENIYNGRNQISAPCNEVIRSLFCEIVRSTITMNFQVVSIVLVYLNCCISVMSRSHSGKFNVYFLSGFIFT